jgi:hypothetical protein
MVSTPVIAESITAAFKVADDDILIFFGLPKYQLCWRGIHTK